MTTIKENIYETLDTHGYTSAYIRWIGLESGERAMDYNEFMNHFGELDDDLIEDNYDLVIMMRNDTWFSRKYNDYYVCWEYCEKPELSNHFEHLELTDITDEIITTDDETSRYIPTLEERLSDIADDFDSYEKGKR